MLTFRHMLAVRIAACLALVALGVVFAVCFRLPAHFILVTGETGRHPVGPITSQAAFVEELGVARPVRIASLEDYLATYGKAAT